MSFFRRPPTSKKPIVRDLRPHKWLLLVMGPVFSLVVASLSSLNTEERVALFLVQALALGMIVHYLPDETQEGEAPTPEATPFRRPATPPPLPPRPTEGSRFGGFGRASSSDSPPRSGLASRFGAPDTNSDNNSSPFQRSSPSPFRRSSDSESSPNDRPASPFRRSSDSESNSNDRPASPFRRSSDSESSPNDRPASPFRRSSDSESSPNDRPLFGSRSSPFRRGDSSADDSSGKDEENKPSLFGRKSNDENMGTTDDMGSVFKRYFDEWKDDDDDQNEDIPF